MPGASYDPFLRRDKTELVRRMRALEQELVTERQARAALAYDQQIVLGKILRLETELLLHHAEQSRSE
jgi:hypothetical protein